ncbi:sensor histidine kinase [Ammoniphilus sp. YIM 78166]|uniref:sensor histidine kinase n=1 Tax=Ammoniphilus sp. YIM 78166 TaxID=1644106 RepID=UPI00106F203F|nr:histidine kinase [Ammoniphilus sp. YIM 78166]
MIVPFVTVLIIINYYSVQVVRNQVADSNHNMLSMYMGEIDRRLSAVDHYLFHLVGQNLDLLDMELPKNMDMDRYMKAQLRLFNSMNQEIGYHESIDLLFIYSAVNQDLFMTQTFGRGYEERAEVRNQILKLVQGDTQPYNNNRWYIWKGDQGYYLFHLVKAGDVYVGAWVDADKIIFPLDRVDFGENGSALLATQDWVPMNHADLVGQYGISLQYEPSRYHLSGDKAQYLVMGQSSSKGHFHLIAFIPESKILEKLPYLQRISSILTIGAGIFLLLFIFFMRKVFLLPISRLIVSIRKLQSGNFSHAHIKEVPTSTEYRMLNEAFNQMVREIEKLKIDVYEEKLNHQKAELKHLQLQINPHFFLNSLNIIYNLATIKDFKLIQEMSMCLVTYFRFMFRSNSSFVTLQDELMHTENYLRIQQLRFPDRLTFHVTAPEQLMNCPIPPLVIQTIVENSVKHAVNMDDYTEITIRVGLEQEQESTYARIEIQDTGRGFPQSVLDQLQQDEEWESKEGEQIGIWNVKRRLRLLYHYQAVIEFSNTPGKGANVRFRLPIKIKKEQELSLFC